MSKISDRPNPSDPPKAIKIDPSKIAPPAMPDPFPSYYVELKPRWEVVSALYHGQELGRLLAEGWEPFSTTVRDGQVPTVWLRKHVVGG